VTRLETGSSVVRFGEFRLDLRSGELEANGQRVVLADQPFRLLTLLIRERGQVVGREDLRRELWSADTFVDFELSLNAAIRRLREALGDSATTPRFIQTLPRRGYRFIADVVESDYPAAAPPASPIPAVEAVGAAASLSTRAVSVDAPPSPGRSRWLWGTVIVAAVALALAVWAAIRPRMAPVIESPALLTGLTTEGTVRMASLSPDATEVAYVCANGTQESLWLRRVGASTALQLVEPADGTFRSLTFGPEDFVYYSFFRPDRTHVSLYRVSTRGGDPAMVHDATGGVVFSPDGTQYAHVSTISLGRRESRVIVSNAATATMRVIAVRQPPQEFLRTRPAWSPDGRYLAVAARDERRPATRELIVIDLQEGRERTVAALNAEAIDAVLWQGGTGTARLIVSARERKARPLRLWQVSVASGEQQPITNDARDYLLAGISHDQQHVVAVRVESSWSLWVAPLTKTSDARQVDSGTGAFELFESLAWTPDGRIVYTHPGSGNMDLWQIDPDSGIRNKVTSDPADDYHPAVSPDGRTVVFASDRSGNPAIWITPIDAERPRRLTSGSDVWPSTSPDGRWVVFQRGISDAAVESVWRVPIDGGEAERVGPPHSYRPVISPDGQFVAHYWMNPEQWALATTPMGSSLPGRALPISRTHGNRVVRWSPDGKALAFIDGLGGASNIWLHPLDAGPARRLTDFVDGTMATFDWSRDGSRLAWMRVRNTGDVVALDLREERP
jgi:Tol biopolymer transport system component/DNA-binding winged helix-turn-helix (wHTH) protein